MEYNGFEYQLTTKEETSHRWKFEVIVEREDEPDWVLSSDQSYRTEGDAVKAAKNLVERRIDLTLRKQG